MSEAMKLRPYQEESREAVEKEWADGKKRTLLVLPTGTGKTIVFSKIIEDQVRAGDRCLILAHRRELLEQASDKLYKSTGIQTATEKAEETSLQSYRRVTVGSVQTMQRDKRLDQFPKDWFDTIVVDEAHHCISSGYQKVLKHFEGAKVLGVTATPDRGDMKNLGEYFESLAYEYGLAQAIREGYLSPIKALTIPLKLDLSGVKQSAGDFSTHDLGDALEPYLWQIADEMVKHCKDRKTVVFLPLVSTSQKFCKILNKKGLKAAEVNGSSPDREQILKRFDKNEFQVLCNSMLLTEGWDCPDVDCVVVLRPTKVRGLYSQMVGRGTRLAPGKKDLLLLDFLWHTDRMDLCHPAHLICKSAEVAQKMTENLENEAENGEGGPTDIGEAEERCHCRAREFTCRTFEGNAETQAEAGRPNPVRNVDPGGRSGGLCTIVRVGNGTAYAETDCTFGTSRNQSRRCRQCRQSGADSGKAEQAPAGRTFYAKTNQVFGTQRFSACRSVVI